MRHPVLPDMPAEEDEVAGFGMASRKVDEALVEVLHLHARLLELRDDAPDLVRHLLDGALSVLNVLGIEPAAVPRHLAAHTRQAPALDHELLPRGNQPPHEGRDHRKGLVRFLLAEEAHTC